MTERKRVGFWWRFVLWLRYLWDARTLAVETTTSGVLVYFRELLVHPRDAVCIPWSVVPEFNAWLQARPPGRALSITTPQGVTVFPAHWTRRLQKHIDEIAAAVEDDGWNPEKKADG